MTDDAELILDKFGYVSDDTEYSAVDTPAGELTYTLDNANLLTMWLGDEIRKKKVNHPVHMKNTIKKIVRDPAYFFSLVSPGMQRVKVRLNY